MRSKAQQFANGAEPQWYWVGCSKPGGVHGGCGAEGPKRRTAAGAVAAWNRAHLGILMGRGREQNIDDYDDD